MSSSSVLSNVVIARHYALEEREDILAVFALIARLPGISEVVNAAILLYPM